MKPRHGRLPEAVKLGSTGWQRVGGNPYTRPIVAGDGRTIKFVLAGQK